MTRIPTCTVLALAVASVSTVAFGQVLHTGTAGTYGTPYATLGNGGSNTWELYRKQGSWAGGAPTVEGTNVTGNNTQVELTGQALGGAGWATGQVMLGYTNATTPSTGLLYLKDMSSALAAGASGYDANGHGNIDLRIGFMQSGSAFITARGGDNKDVDLFSANRGTNGVYMHLAASNKGATTAGGVGNAWTTAYNQGLYTFNATTGNENDTGRVGVNPAQTLINSGTAPVDAGTPYAGPLEMSAKMFADTATPGNVVFQVKLGNNVFTNSFNPNDTVFGANGFDWANAKPVVFTAKGGWDDFNYDHKLHMGVLAKGDANADGRVNAVDTNAVLSNFSGSDKAWAQGDFSQDGKVNAVDTNALLASFGKAITGPVASASAIAIDAPAAGKVDLVVDLSTGNVKLVGGTGANTNNYEIDSASGALNAAAWAKHAGWTTASATDTVMSEFTFSGSQDLNGTSYDLGNIFRPGAAHDLQLFVFDSSFNDVTGTVTYVPEPVSLGLIGLGAMSLMARRRRA